MTIAQQNLNKRILFQWWIKFRGLMQRFDANLMGVLGWSFLGGDGVGEKLELLIRFAKRSTLAPSIWILNVILYFFRKFCPNWSKTWPKNWIFNINNQSLPLLQYHLYNPSVHFSTHCIARHNSLRNNFGIPPPSCYPNSPCLLVTWGKLKLDSLTGVLCVVTPTNEVYYD